MSNTETHLKQNYIGGQWVDSKGGKPHDVINPATEKAAGRISMGSAADVDKAVKAARAAFASWSHTSVDERVALFEKLIEEYKKRYADMAAAITEEMGAPDKLEHDGTVNDDYRIAFLQAHIEQMRLAIADGVELMGYCPWAAIDVVSTHQGYAKRYGFIYVDRGEDDLKRLQRIRKRSFWWYKDVIAQNGNHDESQR